MTLCHWFKGLRVVHAHFSLVCLSILVEKLLGPGRCLHSHWPVGRLDCVAPPIISMRATLYACHWLITQPSKKVFQFKA